MLGIKIDDDEFLEFLKIEAQLEKLERENMIDKFFPDVGTDGSKYGFKTVTYKGEKYQEAISPNKETWSRHLYQQHMEFFKATLDNFFVMMMAANQVGKSTSAGYALALHATGIYPEWWPGDRYDHPIKAWACGVDSKQMREVIQERLLGPVGDFGTGLIRKSCLNFETLKDASKADTFVGIFHVRHISGGWSTIELKSYESGVRAFMGPTKDLIWLDEEPPMDIYEECKTRLITTGGKIMMTFTPLLGMTDTIENFMGSTDYVTGPIVGKDGEATSRFVVAATWDDVPHITESAKRIQLEGMPEYLRDAKSKGIPALGSGAVYPVNLDTVFVDPFKIPRHWKRVFGMDFGFEDPTAVVWAATNPDDDITYIYSEHYLSKQVAAIHAGAIKVRDKQAEFRIPGVADPSGGGRNSGDGKLVRDTYNNELDIKFIAANNSITPGISNVLSKLVDGSLKIFNTCVNTKGEMKKYRYEKGKLKGSDHAMDALRYLVISGLPIAQNYDDVIEVDYTETRSGTVFAG
jgi:phage terminase large subunit-like protein